MRLADIAMIQGNTTLSIELERNSSAYKDSLYQLRRNPVAKRIIEVEADVQTILQKLYYKGRLQMYLYSFILITIIIIAISLYLYKRYQRKNNLLKKDKQQLEKINQDLSQHHANLQTDITQKGMEIEKLRKELASHQVNEEQRKKLQAELDKIVLKRKTLAKEAFLHSPIYEKMQAIIKDFQDKDASDKEKKKLEEKRNELTNDKQQLESNKKELQSSIDEIDSSKSELDAEVAECNEVMKSLSSQSSEYKELIETNQAQLEQVESEIRAAIASASRGSGSISGSTGNGYGWYKCNGRRYLKD